MHLIHVRASPPNRIVPERDEIRKFQFTASVAHSKKSLEQLQATVRKNIIVFL